MTQPRDTAPERDAILPTVAIIVASVGYFSASGVSFPVLPELVKAHSDGGNSAIGLAFSSYAVGLLIARPFVGFLNDRFGRTPMVVAGAVVMAVAQLFYVPAAENFGLTGLMSLRFFIGIFGSAMYVGLATIATEISSPERRAQVFAWFSASVFVGFAIGPLVGELVAQEYGFRWAYGVASGFTVVTVLCALLLPETRPEGINPNMGTMREIFDPVGLRVGAAAFVGVLAFMGLQGFVKQWGQELGVENAGPILATYAVVVLVLRVVGGKLMNGDRIRVGSFAFAAMVVSSLMFAFADGPLLLFGGAAVLAIGSAFVMPILLLIATDSTPAASRARVVSTVTFINDVGASAGIPLLGVIADGAGFPAMYLTLGGLVILALAYFRSPGITSLPGATT